MCHIKMVHCHITSTKLSHQSETLSHHFQVWRQKCHINVMHCHITFTKVSHQSETLSHHFGISGYFSYTQDVFQGFQGHFPLTSSILSYKMRIWRSQNRYISSSFRLPAKESVTKNDEENNPKNSFHKPAPTQSRIFLSSYL